VWATGRRGMGTTDPRDGFDALRGELQSTLHSPRNRGKKYVSNAWGTSKEGLPTEYVWEK